MRGIRAWGIVMVALGLAATTAQAEPVRLTDHQMADITADSARHIVQAVVGSLRARRDEAGSAIPGPATSAPSILVTTTRGAFNSGDGNTGAFNGGNGNVGAFNGNLNTGTDNGNGNIGAFNGNLNGGDGNGNSNIGAFNGNLNGNNNLGSGNGDNNGNGNAGALGVGIGSRVLILLRSARPT
jgi:hypothetical protein